MTANDWFRRDYFRSKVISAVAPKFPRSPAGIPPETGLQGMVNGCLETITFQNV